MQEFTNRPSNRRVKSLIKKLQKTCKQLNNQYDINSGGCCFVALEIAKKLEELGINYKVLIISRYYPINKEGMIKMVKNKKTPLLTCNHYAIKAEGKVINLGKIYKGEHVYSFNFNSKDLESIYDRGRWNDNYNIYYNSIISQIINEL